MHYRVDEGPSRVGLEKMTSSQIDTASRRPTDGAARPRRPVPKVSKRVIARVENAGVPGADNTLAPQRLVAAFGDLAPRTVTDNERQRYRAICAAFGLSAEQADADLEHLVPAVALGA